MKKYKVERLEGDIFEISKVKRQAYALYINFDRTTVDYYRQKALLESDLEFIPVAVELDGEKRYFEYDEFRALVMNGRAEVERLTAALLLVLDQVDYTVGNCRPNEMIGAVLPVEVITVARKALEDVK